MKQFVLPRKDAVTNTDEISLWIAYHATPVSTLGLSSLMTRAPKVNVYVVCVLGQLSIASRMLINRTIIACRTKCYLGTVGAQTILAIQALLGLLEDLSKSDHGS